MTSSRLNELYACIEQAERITNAEHEYSEHLVDCSQRAAGNACTTCALLADRIRRARGEQS